ncbi:MAG: hypothetical protein ABI193_23390 [Minicystis sp.]
MAAANATSSIAHSALPALTATEQAYLDELVRFVETASPEDAELHEALADLGRNYRGNQGAEIADWNAGQHPFQSPR